MPKFAQKSSSTAVTPRIQTPVITVPQCMVCTSPHRSLIERALVMGMTYSEIEREFEFAGIKRRSVAKHKEKHLNYEDAAIRAIIEKEASQARMNIEDGVERLVNQRSYIKIALQKGYEAMINGDVVVEPKDAAKLIELQSRLETNNATAAIEELSFQLNITLKAIREVVPKAQWNDVVNRIFELAKESGREVPMGQIESQTS